MLALDEAIFVGEFAGDIEPEADTVRRFAPDLRDAELMEAR